MTAEPNDTPEQLGNARDLIKLINAGALSQAISVAADLRIPDLLARGPSKVDALAQATSAHAESLRRLLRALSSVGLCREADDGSFTLSPLGQLLRSASPNSLRPLALLWGKYQWPVWANLTYSVQTGESARKSALGADGLSYLETDPHA